MLLGLISSCSKRGPLSGCVCTYHCSGFSCCDTWAYLLCRIKLLSSALAGGLFTTEPLRKPFLIPFFFFNLFWPIHMACGILVPQLGIEPVPPALAKQYFFPPLVVPDLRGYSWAFSSHGEQGLLVIAQASYCSGFSCCEAQALILKLQ